MSALRARGNPNIGSPRSIGDAAHETEWLIAHNAPCSHGIYGRTSGCELNHLMAAPFASLSARNGSDFDDCFCDKIKECQLARLRRAMAQGLL